MNRQPFSHSSLVLTVDNTHEMEEIEMKLMDSTALDDGRRPKEAG
jgi:hypothetical protein